MGRRRESENLREIESDGNEKERQVELAQVRREASKLRREREEWASEYMEMKGELERARVEIENLRARERHGKEEGKGKMVASEMKGKGGWQGEEGKGGQGGKGGNEGWRWHNGRWWHKQGEWDWNVGYGGGGYSGHYD